MAESLEFGRIRNCSLLEEKLIYETRQNQKSHE